MSRPRTWLLMGLVPVVLACAASCNSVELTRTEVGPGEALLSYLGFLNEPGVTRDTVVARLGQPTALFEDGRIVSYAVYADAERQQLSLAEGRGSCYGLMIEYGARWWVARHSLIRSGSARCRKLS